MVKVLYVGDVHARPDCLDEMWRLIHYIRKIAQENGVGFTCFLGDQFHTHSVIHLSVLSFWQKAFKALWPHNPYALVGNHDMSGKKDDEDHALMLYDYSDVTVVAKPTMLPWNVLAVPYQSDHEAFVKACQKDVPVVVCHQTFDGSKYENGFYAKDGIDPNLIPQEQVISGHIHAPQKIGKVWYPGSPRWQSVSDANTERNIWLVTHGEDGRMVEMQSFSTEGVCRPIYTLVDRETEPVELPSGNADIIVDVFGSPDYVRRRAAELQAAGARVRQFPETTREIKVRESEGLPVSFKKFIGHHQPKFGTPTNRLMEMAQERISWLKA